MGSMKELLFDLQEQRADEWIDDNFPDAEEGTPEWDMAAQNYSWMLDDLAEQAERQWFQDSLNDLDDRYTHAARELDELKELVNPAQAGIVLRMAYAHTVTVMEAFLMYSARALLNDGEHLDRFYTNVASVPKIKGTIRKCAQAVLDNTQKHPKGTPPDEAAQLRRTAQLFVSQQTFHNLNNLKDFFYLYLKHRLSGLLNPFKTLLKRVRTWFTVTASINTMNRFISGAGNWKWRSGIFGHSLMR